MASGRDPGKKGHVYNIVTSGTCDNLLFQC